MNSKEILELFPQAKSKPMSCFLLMWVHHRFTRICSTLDHSINSNCYFVNFAESFSQLRTSASFMILVQEFASVIHHLQRPNELLVNFKPPEKVEKTSTNSPPPNFFQRNHTADFFLGGACLSGAENCRNIPGVQIWRYQQRSGQARQERHGQLVGSGAGVVDGSWMGILAQNFTHIHGG